MHTQGIEKEENIENIIFSFPRKAQFLQTIKVFPHRSLIISKSSAVQAQCHLD